MTQQEQQEFLENLEAALSWMRAVHERLRANDNTQGPRGALEGRLRETEKIHQSEHEGRLKVDLALVAAETLLQSGDEELKTQTNARLKDLKGQWEETCTYIIHCHSRIEWVWLHWGEYLKAREEFELWLSARRRGLDVAVELQLGVKEKLWQVDQQRVVLSDVQGQAALLERLLDEAAALHNRTQDPSVDSQAQERLQEAYNTVRDQAEERLLLLQKVAEEHETYQSCVQRFQSWLLSKTKELTDLMEKEDTAENKLKALQALDDNVAGEEKTLQHIEGLAEGVRSNTSPSGAEAVVEEAEELRLGWQRLRQGLCETEDGLRSSLDSHSQYMARCQRLGEDIGLFRALLQGLDHDLERSLHQRECRDQTEEQMVGQWRKYTGVRNTLAGEESQVELLKAQLKELFRFSHDSRHLSDDVLAVVKEHQSVKCRATRLCSESESGLRSLLQDPLLVYAQWSLTVSHVLETSADVADFSHIAMLVQSIERLLKGSVQLQERLSLLQVKGDLLDSVFGPDGADGFQAELGAAVRNRELLHTQLLQRKSRLQGLISRTKDFSDAYDMIRSKLASLREQLMATDGLQPDILAKKSQSDQFMVILKDLEDLEAHVTALETLVSSSPSNRTQFERLSADWKILHKAARLKVHESEDGIAAHEDFHERLLNVEKWLMIMKQKLESFHSSSGEWCIVGRSHEAQRALGEFPEKELQLQQMEVKGQGVLERTSEDGRIHIVRDIKRLRESWLSLYNMSLNLHRLLNSTEQTDSHSAFAGPADPPQLRDSPSHAAGTRDTSSGPGRGGRVDGHEGQSAQVIGHLVLTGQDDELSPFKGDQVDSSSWSVSSRDVSSRDVHNVSDYETSAGGVGVGTSTTAVGLGERSLSSGEGNMEAGGGGGGRGGGAGGGEGAGGRGGGAGGAFMLFRRDTTKPPSTAPKQHVTGTSGEHTSRRREFEAWLAKENQLLSGIFSIKGAKLSPEEVQTRQDTLKALRTDVAWGQDQFQMLLQDSVGRDAGPGSAEDVSLEELRYRWMLYKSKLKEAGDVRARAKRVRAKPELPAVAAKVQKKAGLLQRVCRLALPLWLLLLALLLLAFLLPLMDEGHSCSLSNNFARSFNIMLRYNGPPPT